MFFLFSCTAILLQLTALDCLTQKMAEPFQEVAANVLGKNKCILLECKGEGNHIHLLLDIHVDNNISTLLGSIKSATSRIQRIRI